MLGSNAVTKLSRRAAFYNHDKLNKMEETEYQREVLLRLKRKYRKDEEMMLLFKEISELRIQVGKDKSYIHELHAHITSITKQLNLSGKSVAAEKLRLEEATKLVKGRLVRNGDLKREIIVWRNKYFDLLLKYERVAKVEDAGDNDKVHINSPDG